jgi:hypothetical protein
MCMIDTRRSLKAVLVAGTLVAGSLAAASTPTAASASIAVGQQVRLEGTIRFDPHWRSEAIVPFTIELDSPQVFAGDGICDTVPRQILDLWQGDPRAFSSLIDRRVVVTGMIDCPRGGHVVINPRVQPASTASAQASAPAAPPLPPQRPARLMQGQPAQAFAAAPSRPANRAPVQQAPARQPATFVPPSQLPIELRCRQYLDWLIRGRELRALPDYNSWPTAAMARGLEAGYFSDETMLRVFGVLPSEIDEETWVQALREKLPCEPPRGSSPFRIRETNLHFVKHARSLRYSLPEAQHEREALNEVEAQITRDAIDLDRLITLADASTGESFTHVKYWPTEVERLRKKARDLHAQEKDGFIAAFQVAMTSGIRSDQDLEEAGRLLREYGTRAPRNASRTAGLTTQTLNLEWQEALVESFFDAAESRLTNPVDQLRRALARNDMAAYAKAIDLNRLIFPIEGDAWTIARRDALLYEAFVERFAERFADVPIRHNEVLHKVMQAHRDATCTRLRGQLGDAMGMTLAKIGEGFFAERPTLGSLLCTLAEQGAIVNVTVQQSFWGRLTGAPRVFVADIENRYRASYGVTNLRLHLAEPEAYRREVVARAGQPGIGNFAITDTSRLAEFADLFMLKLEAIGPEPGELSLDAPHDLRLTRLLHRGQIDPVSLYKAFGG